MNAYLAKQWPAIRAQVIERDKECRECARPYPTATMAIWQERWEVDHIIPVADGGTDDPENLRLLCRECHVKITSEWRRNRSRPTDAEKGRES